MIGDSDVTRTHGGLISVLHARMVGARSALSSKFRRFLARPIERRSVARAPDVALMRLEGNLTPARLLRAARSVLFPLKVGQLWKLGFLRSYFGHLKHPDKFFFLAHEFYLSRRLTLRQRVACAVSHYRHERASCGAAYHDAVYRSAEGLTLWHRMVNGTRYTLSLRATEDVRREGDLSILCLVDDVRVCRLSFSYVQGALFGTDEPTTVFVTRNQSDRNPELQRFRTDFKQNSPPYFCMAALCGIAMAHGIRNVFLIRDEAQVAYDARYAEGFKNSYSSFWQAFGAKEHVTRNAYVMTVPPDLNPIETVKHKARAVARRQNWLEIIVNARHAIVENRVTHFPVPIDVQTSSLLRNPGASTPAASQVRSLSKYST